MVGHADVLDIDNEIVIPPMPKASIVCA